MASVIDTGDEGPDNYTLDIAGQQQGYIVSHLSYDGMSLYRTEVSKTLILAGVESDGLKISAEELALRFGLTSSMGAYLNISTVRKDYGPSYSSL